MMPVFWWLLLLLFSTIQVAPGDITNYFSLMLGLGYVLRPLFFRFPHRKEGLLRSAYFCYFQAL